MIKHLAANALTVVLVLCIAGIGVVYFGVQQFQAEGPAAEPIRVNIESGDSLKVASERLAEAGAIENAMIFRLGARYQNLDKQLKFGEYEIPALASMEEVLDIVTSGQSIQYRVTVAEGLTSWEVVELLKANELLTGDIEEVPAEGSLAPDTYFVGRGTDRNLILRRMAEAQARILEEAWAARDADTPLASPAEVLTLASIIEKETALAEERPKVGGVFVNRLRRGMRIQSDPTIIYGITEGQGPLDRPILRSDIRRPTAYNTYIIDRLPPGPIANPGRDAIMAAVKPQVTEALYFVADGTGGHAFANTLAEHERNVAAWRKIERERANQ
ncbi:MAG: endolytic transglycosylase MltG [Pseudomonadota bacterium]